MVLTACTVCHQWHGIKHNHFTCFYTNADSLLNKRGEFAAASTHHAPNVICVNEVVPKKAQMKAQESEFQLEGFDAHTNLPTCKRGVIIYTRKHLKTSPVNNLPQDFDESCCVEINLTSPDKLLVGCIYRSQNSDKENNLNLMRGIKDISHRKTYSRILMCEDFNLPEGKWTDTAHLPSGR